MKKLLVAALKRIVVRAISKEDAERFLDGLGGKKASQKDLDAFVEKNQYNEEEIETLMYDLRQSSILDLEAPEAPKIDSSEIPIKSLEELIKYMPDYSAISVEVGDDWGDEGMGPLGNPRTLFTNHPMGTSKTYDSKGWYHWGQGIHYGDNDGLIEELVAEGYEANETYTTDVGLIVSAKNGQEQIVYFQDTIEAAKLEKEWQKWWDEKEEDIKKNGQTLIDPKDLPKYQFPDKQKNNAAEESE